MTPLDIEALVRPAVRRLEPYRSARHAAREGILLDANELPSSLPLDETQRLHRYPDPSQRELRRRLAELEQVDPTSVFVGSGSDEIISLLVTAFCEPRVDSIVVCPPTYGMYAVTAAIHDVDVVEAPLDRELALDRFALASSLARTPRPKLVVCCSPNNPTGGLVDAASIEWLCESSRAVVVVDEAYVEFAGEGASIAPLLTRHANLVVLRTLSKAWGLAGLRIGYALSHPSIVEILMKIKPPYNVGSMAATSALRVLSDPAAMRDSVAAIVAERERLAACLAGLSCVEKVLGSDANFLLVRMRDAEAALSALAAEGIVVRDRSSESRLAGCIRITVGRSWQNDRLLDVLRALATKALPAEAA